MRMDLRGCLVLALALLGVNLLMQSAKIHYKVRRRSSVGSDSQPALPAGVHDIAVANGGTVLLTFVRQEQAREVEKDLHR